MAELTSKVPIEQRIVLDWISWEYYEQTLREFAEGHLRVTYDNDRLELMKPSNQHKYVVKCIERLTNTFDDLAGVGLTGMGLLTCSRRHLKKGIDPDGCYYVGGFPRHADTGDVLEEHPRPDLVIESRISRSAIDRMSIFAALGVSEVWLYEEGQLKLNVLEGERYRQAERSTVLPQLNWETFNRFVARSI
jgi:Uma2 family endonuclease